MDDVVASSQAFSTTNFSYVAAATLSIPIWDGGVTKAKVDQDTANPKTVEFTYCNACGWGKRLTKKVTDTTGVVLNTRYIWDGDNVIGEVDAATGAPSNDYTVMPFSLMSNVLEVTRHEAPGTVIC